MKKIKDIVADIRNRNDGGFPLDGESSHPLVEDMRLLADDIEETYEFEIAVEKAKAAGEGYSAGYSSGYSAGKKSGTNYNQAKMREALELMLYWHNELKDDVDAMNEAMEKAKVSLSYPPRNCDKFSNATDAQLEFLNEVWLVSADKESILDQHRIENWTEEMLMRYSRWLLSPVKNGKNDESK